MNSILRTSTLDGLLMNRIICCRASVIHAFAAVGSHHTRSIRLFLKEYKPKQPAWGTKLMLYTFRPNDPHNTRRSKRTMKTVGDESRGEQAQPELNVDTAT